MEYNNVEQPTFAADSTLIYTNLTPEIFQFRQLLSDALSDLWYLTQGPSESIFNYVHNVMPDAAALNTLNYFDFWSAVPLASSSSGSSYAEIAKHTFLPEDVVVRLLKHAFTLRLFPETDHGRVVHASRSAALATQPGLRALVSSVLDTSSAPLLLLNHALDRYSRGRPELTQELWETSFALFHAGGVFGEKYKVLWDYLENDGDDEGPRKKGWRQKEFVEFMRYIKEIFRLKELIVDCFDWEDAGEARVVDVGGSAGHDSVVLARKFPNLTFIVQDLPMVQPVFEADLPADLRPRVSFQEHNIFDPQPARADIFMVELILHDYPEPEAAKILRALVPTLRHGNRVLVFEYIGKVEGGQGNGPIARSVKQMGTATDLRMMALFNAKERPGEAYREIFQRADERFDVVSVKADPLTFLAVIEAVWRGK
ncbi:hypothetical protein LQW54_000766 [Pestalotiopsis sp. IQ-011]